jgi:hypothetical protein
MKLNELRKVIREEVKAAIQEELKDILLEAVKSPKGAITENSAVASKPQVDPAAQQAARQSIMNSMMGTGGNPMLTSKDVNTFNPQGAMPGGDLPAGNVGLDQIMGLMNSK